jgi:GNAT superfamily N-acetyltransferase
MTLNRRPVSDCTAATVAHALTTCFEGYIVPMRMTGEQYERRFRAEHLDPFASAVWFDGEAPAVIALICRRGSTSRLAAFGVAAAQRSKGLAKATMKDVIAEARARGDARIVLEVIEGNDAALRLYESLGFTMRRRLVGYDWSPPLGDRAPKNLREVDLAEAAMLLTGFADSDLSWQFDPAGLFGLSPPTTGFALDNTAVAILEPSGETLRVHGIAVDPQRRRSGLGRMLLEGIAATRPVSRWVIPAIAPEGLASEFLARLGWRLTSLSQREMTLSLVTK